ncbi:MAG: glycerol-3-phosphate 1-O-acyltransferase PlsY [Syntrophales bacterium]|nr:glycerol-3-phosphate 1-O-acyltransferase PlsY [Syntrophales bacterium]MDD5642118.1 glycerol-3-phosphate 1-O-acyltransferase PlsY [Syntrophales bacterium]
MAYFLGLTFLAYLLGSIPFGLVVSRWLGGPDPRSMGSGNLGAANLYRLLGLKGGALTFLGDALKGALPVLLALFSPGPQGAWRDAAVAVVGGAAVLGHVFPLYLKFKGGKGVATAFGVVAALSPWAALTLVLVYILALAQTRIFSLSALICAWLLPVVMGLFAASKAYLLLAGFLSGLVLICHRENLERLFKGEEPRI